ncbi:hypothetical protein C8245_23010 [Paracidovorax avenae]|uniref:hypothetical protein n=1 Tax=Paracidovorax avenae TaxID=80867 RepID=UPI000D217A49|nr:hypothetical protein [Paracidovorax avenae]AVS68148.1 hypothetical protein C8245_23010 [Paracidovorax avenae]
MSEHTRESVLAAVLSGPTRFQDLAGDLVGRYRKPLRRIVDGLVSEGLIRLIHLGREQSYVAKDWTPSESYLLERIFNRCIETDAGCLEWQGHVEPERGPMFRPSSEMHPVSARRIVWSGIKGKRIAKYRSIKLACGNEACLRVEHMKSQPRLTAKRGKPISNLHRAHIAEGRRKSRAKLDLEAARAIRASTETVAKASKRWGVSEATISAIRLNRIWKEYDTPFAGMFTGLLQRGAKP